MEASRYHVSDRSCLQMPIFCAECIIKALPLCPLFSADSEGADQVQAQLEQLRRSVAEAQQRLREVQEQLTRNAPCAEKTSTPRLATKQQHTRHQTQV